MSSVKCYNGVKSVCSVKTFDELRLTTKSNKVIGLDQLPPTSSVIRAHIRRAFYHIRNDISLLEEPPLLDPLDFSWKECDGVLLPDKTLNLSQKYYSSCVDALESVTILSAVAKYLARSV